MAWRAEVKINHYTKYYKNPSVDDYPTGKKFSHSSYDSKDYEDRPTHSDVVSDFNYRHRLSANEIEVEVISVYKI